MNHLLSNDPYFERLVAECGLTKEAATQLDDAGFTVITGPAPEDIGALAAAYDAAVSTAPPGERSLGRTKTNLRISGLAGHGAFDHVYVFPPLLAACCAVIRQPFKLSALHARSVLPYSAEQALHVDFEREVDGWPMLGFILMIDDFRVENGATRFVPGSHRWAPSGVTTNATAHDAQIAACGPAGSLIIYNGSVWHGFGANQTDHPRRSIQGAFIRRTAQGAMEGANLLRPGARERIGRLAKYLLDA